MKRSAAMMFLVPMVGCVTVSKNETVSTKVLREWNDNGPVISNSPIIVVDENPVGSTISGRVFRQEKCKHLAHKEIENTVTIEKSAGYMDWTLMALGSVGIIGGTGYYLDKQEVSVDVLGTSLGIVVASLGLIGYGAYLAIASIDETTVKPKEIITKEGEEIICGNPAVTNTDLRISENVSLNIGSNLVKTDAEGRFRVDLSKLPGFIYPADDTATEVILSFENAKQKVQLGSWAYSANDNAIGCSSQKSCEDELGRLLVTNDPRLGSIIAMMKTKLHVISIVSNHNPVDYQSFLRTKESMPYRQGLLLRLVNEIGSMSLDKSQKLEHLEYVMNDSAIGLTDFERIPFSDLSDELKYGLRKHLLYSGIDGCRVTDILRLKTQGLSDVVIVGKLTQERAHFDKLSDADIVALRKVGLSDDIVGAMLTLNGKYESDMETRKLQRAQVNATVKACEGNCQTEYQSCADRRGRGFLDAVLWDTTACSQQFRTCIDSCQ